MLIELPSQIACNPFTTDSQSEKAAQKLTLPTRKWQFIYFISIILSLPELIIWKWCKRKEKCYLPTDPAKSKQYVKGFHSTKVLEQGSTDRKRRLLRTLSK